VLILATARNSQYDTQYGNRRCETTALSPVEAILPRTILPAAAKLSRKFETNGLPLHAILVNRTIGAYFTIFGQNGQMLQATIC